MLDTKTYPVAHSLPKVKLQAHCFRYLVEARVCGHQVTMGTPIKSAQVCLIVYLWETFLLSMEADSCSIRRCPVISVEGLQGCVQIQRSMLCHLLYFSQGFYSSGLFCCGPDGLGRVITSCSSGTSLLSCLLL